MKWISKYFVKQIKSFGPAFKGIRWMLKDPNIFVHFPAACVVVGFAWYFEVSQLEWLWLLWAISVVWITETINTSIEKLVDLVSPDYHELAGKAKDLAAAAVLLATFFAITVGGIVFFPYLKNLF